MFVIKKKMGQNFFVEICLRYSAYNVGIFAYDLISRVSKIVNCHIFFSVVENAIF